MADCLGVIGGSCLCEQIVNWKSKQCFIMTVCFAADHVISQWNNKCCMSCKKRVGMSTKVSKNGRK